MRVLKSFRNRNSFWEADFDQEKKNQGTISKYCAKMIFGTYVLSGGPLIYREAL